MEWDLRKSNQVRSSERSGQGSQESGDSTPRQEVLCHRDLTETEYRKVVHELYGKGSFESTIRTACMLKQQVHLITRTDDISKLKYSDYKPHQTSLLRQLQGALVQEYSGRTTMPRPNILGSMDTDFCAMLGLANYMEASFNYGYGAAGREDAFLFTPESDPKLAPSTATQPTATFSRLSFCRLHFWLWRSSLLVFLGVTAFGSLLQLWQEGWVLLLTKLTFEVAGRLACLDGLLMPTFRLNSPGSTPVLPKSFAWGLLLPTSYTRMPRE
ncbi:expressed unknown protein [Seminavis robusta]|uniref:Uncharacterized protein n=1 Tax=Seminavis robusta TaxID=568900 RepID=A0A9N8EAJ0_9STRA|nr:expressed unknown protein [Seminavis robusta]|eukprot:Sro807_g205280.1 n/a (270) ;mRNA; f:30682-31491